MKMEDLVNYCKQYGFIFQGSEIYGGLANTWDFGPVGALLKENVKNYLDIFRDKSIELEPKPSIKKQLSDNKNISTQKKPAKSKNNDLEV